MTTVTTEIHKQSEDVSAMNFTYFYTGFAIIGLGVCYLLAPPKTVDDAVRGVFSCGAVFLFFGIVKELAGKRRKEQ